MVFVVRPQFVTKTQSDYLLVSAYSSPSIVCNPKPKIKDTRFLSEGTTYKLRPHPCPYVVCSCQSCNSWPPAPPTSHFKCYLVALTSRVLIHEGNITLSNRSRIPDFNLGDRLHSLSSLEVLEGFVIFKKWVLISLCKISKANFDDILYKLIIVIKDPTFLNSVYIVLVYAFHQHVDVVGQVCRCVSHSLVCAKDVIETFWQLSKNFNTGCNQLNPFPACIGSMCFIKNLGEDVSWDFLMNLYAYFNPIVQMFLH